MKKFYISILAGLLLLSGCFEDFDDTINPASALEIQNFIYRGLNYFYLYKADTPELANDAFLSNDDKNSFFIKTKGNVLLSDSYFSNELFRFGGINSIRGFEENSIIASYYGLINLEYRYRLNSGIYVHSITDAAYFENKIIDAKEKLLVVNDTTNLANKMVLNKKATTFVAAFLLFVMLNIVQRLKIIEQLIFL
jgi:hypothetical protein